MNNRLLKKQYEEQAVKEKKNEQKAENAMKKMKKKTPNGDGVGVQGSGWRERERGRR